MIVPRAHEMLADMIIFFVASVAAIIIREEVRRMSHSPARVRWSNRGDTSSVRMIDVRLLGVSGGSRLEDDARRQRGRSGAMIVILSSPPEMSTSSS